MKRKAQVKFGETIGVIFIVYFILFFGLTWYNSSNADELEELYLEQQQAIASEKYYFIVNSDRLHYSEQGDLNSEFDYYSFLAFEEYAKEEGKVFLDKQLGEALITLDVYEHSEIRDLEKNRTETQIYKSIVLYNGTPSIDKTKEFRYSIENFKTTLPIFDSYTSEHYLGILQVKAFIKQ